jgi:hypothetical protein
MNKTREIMKKVKEFLMDMDWIICQIVGVAFLMQDWTIPGCTLLLLSLYLSEKKR